MTTGINHYIFISALLLGLGILSALSKKNIFRVIAGLALIFTSCLINIAAFTGINNFNPEGQVILFLTVLILIIIMTVGISLFLKQYKQTGSAEIKDA